MFDIQSKRLRDSSDDEDDLNLQEQGFLKKNRFTSRQKQRNLQISEFDSDSYEDSGNDSENDVKDNEDPRNQDNNNSDSDDMFAFEDKNDSKKHEINQETTKDAFDYEDPKYDEEESTEPVQNIQLEAFNMDENNPRDEAYNNTNNDFSQNREDYGEDQWINEIVDVESVAKSQKRDVERRRKRVNELQNQKRHYMVDEALLRLLYFVSHTETVLMTLGRFNRLRNHNKSSPEYVINAINFITDLIDILGHKGIKDIYNLKRPNLSKLIEEESLSNSNLIDDYKTKMWSFKWIEKPEKIYGEYTNYQMQYWKNSYFQHQVAVKFDHEPDEPANWMHIDCISFM